MMALGVGTSAQILLSEGFEGTTLPPGWTSSATPASAAQGVTLSMWTGGTACSGTKMAYRNLYGSVTSHSIVYSSVNSNATDLAYSFKYAAKGFSTSGSIKGTVIWEYSVDGGTTWASLGTPVALDSPNASPVPCTTISGVIPGASIPVGADFKFRLTGTYTSPADFYLGFDDVQLTQVVTAPPGCTTLSAPTAGATGVSVTPSLSWVSAVGATQYLLNIGTSPGATDVINGQNVGNGNSYTLPAANTLNYSTTYYVRIIPTNNLGSNANCPEVSFTTLAVPCPSVSAPSNNSINVSVTPTITWTAVAGATGYRLSVGTTSGGTDVVNNADLGNVSTYLFTSNLNYSTDYYYTVNSYQGTASNSASCTVRKFTTKAIDPVNDNCANATTVTVNPDLSCTAVVSGTTLGGTASGVALGTCTGSADDDVWYKFVATSTAHSIQLKNVVSVGNTSSTSLYAQVLSGSCGSLTSVRCITSNTNYSYLGSLTVGQTYYVRVYNSEANTSSSVYANTFDLCIGTLPAAPANDECSAAANLVVNSTLNCSSPVAGTTLQATSSGVAVGTCTGNPDDDVWYSFTAVGTDHTVLLSNVTSVGSSSSTSLNTQIFSGVCGTLTSIKCGTTNTTVVNGLTPGALYYVRVYNSNANTATALYANTFNICIGTPPPPPANDNIAGAFTLTVNPDYACGTVTPATTESATASTPAPSCTAAGANDDVWFKFIATNAVHRVSLANTSGSADMNMVVYGADGTTELTSAVGGACANVSTKNLTGLTVGNTYFVRVYTNSSSSTTISSFTVCVGTPPPAPVNDNIGSAINLVPSATGICSSSVTGTTVSATQSAGETAPTCAATAIDDDVWYSFVASSTTHFVNVEYADNATVTQVYSGAPGSLTAVACYSGNYGNSNLLLNSLTVGSIYYVRIYSASTTSSTNSNFNICVTTPVVPANDLIAGALLLNSCTGNVISGNNAVATNDTLPASSCGSTTNYNYKGVWFKVTPALSGAVTIDACGSKFDTYLRVYSDNAGTLTCVNNTSGVGYADSGCAVTVNNASKLTFNAVAGTTYYALLSSYSDTNFGNYSITATQDCSSLATTDVATTKLDDIKAYPNPFADVLTISDVKDVKSIMISDISGKIVRTITKPESTLRLADLNSGMYLVILNMNDGSRQTIKAIKK